MNTVTTGTTFAVIVTPLSFLTWKYCTPVLRSLFPPADAAEKVGIYPECKIFCATIVAMIIYFLCEQ
jgi:hypothetical protein